ncbi:hypothetical protein GW17_00006667 [Ensete ventricosum]|nr:hypothetical protein GW17_00006667 [Ensete ventricosum]
MRALSIALQDLAINHLDVESTAFLNLEHHPGNNLVVHEVVGTPGIDEDGGGLLLEETSDLHHLRIRIAS